MQLAIVQNPHVEKPEILWKTLQDQSMDHNSENKKDEFDKQGFELLKQKLRQNPRFNVK